jgi:flagellar basal body P-ring protein FlgI
MVTSVENPDSQRYAVANGIIASTALFTRRGQASLKEHQNSPGLF